MVNKNIRSKKSANLVTYMARRYLRFDRTQPFISIVAIMAFVGVGIGVMVLIVVMSIMNGMTNEFKRRILSTNYPITVMATTSAKISDNLLIYLRKELPDMYFSPFIRTQAVVKTGGQMNSIALYGVNLYDEKKVNSVLSKHVESDNFDSLYQIIIGSALMDRLLLNFGDRVTLLFPELVPNGLSISPKIKSFSVFSTFSSGLKSYDSLIAYTSLKSLSIVKNTRDNEYDGIHIYSNDPPKDKSRVLGVINDYEMQVGEQNVVVDGWWERNSNFFSAMELEKRALFVVLMLIILMASLNIVSSLLMVVMSRRREIALLISLGATRKEIKNIFFYLGSIIGGLGVLFGVIGSFIVMKILVMFPIIKIPEDVYGVSTLPIEPMLGDVILTIIGSAFIVLVSSLYPSIKASRVNALSVLRNE